MEELEELADWEDQLTKWLESLRQRILAINAVVLDGLYEFIDKVDNTLSLGENLNVLLAAQFQLPRLIQSAGYGVMVNNLVTKIGETITKVDSYLNKVFNNQPDKIRKVTNTFTAALAKVRESLLGEGIQQGMVGEIVKTMQFHIYSKSTKTAFREALRKVLGNDGQVVKSLTTYSSYALYQYSRAYTLEVTKELDAQFYYYMGNRIETTREFCHHRHGKAFTKKQVLSWLKLDWKGKIPGTSILSIFMYVGGYNCRHRLIPISEEMFIRLGGIA
ncbi:hypothetical protein [Runella sp.]|uniref:hypothetical protein n=1 Tax=Runella sp. TaxID=1960881 RepID=UPI003D0D6F2C